jgi:hypothetical protein
MLCAARALEVMYKLGLRRLECNLLCFSINTAVDHAVERLELRRVGAHSLVQCEGCECCAFVLVISNDERLCGMSVTRHTKDLDATYNFGDTALAQSLHWVVKRRHVVSNLTAYSSKLAFSSYFHVVLDNESIDLLHA